MKYLLKITDYWIYTTYVIVYSLDSASKRFIRFINILSK